MATIYDGKDRKIKTSLNSEDVYKVYDADGNRITKLEFSTNGLTNELGVTILLDRLTRANKRNAHPYTTHAISCLENALLAIKLQAIKRVPSLMSNHGYAELNVDLSSGHKLLSAIVPAMEEGVDLIPLNKLHATLMYDVRNPEIIPDASNKVYKGTVVGVKMLGDPGSRWRAVALELDSPTVQARHKELLAQGFKHSYDDLLLHVSLCYGQDAEIIFPIVEGLLKEGKLPTTITLCNETWDQCKD